MSGHLFICHSDLTRIRCDHWLLPSDGGLGVSRSWRHTSMWEERALRSAIRKVRAKLPDGWGTNGIRTLPLPLEGPQRPWITNVGAHRGLRRGEPDVDWYVEGARQFVRGATAVGGTLERARPLLALPIVGTGFGGARRAAGTLLGPLVEMLLDHVSRHDVDVVLVAFDPPDFAAAQAARRARIREGLDLWERALGPQLADQARALATDAVRGQLVVFLGAGVSAGAGLPTWSALLDQLAAQAGLSEAERTGLEQLGYLDRAQVIDRRLGDEAVGDAVSEQLGRYTEHGLAHALLAGLPVTEFITTNYDALFEAASDAARRPVAVLPYAPDADRSRWLLKLHGCVTRPDDIVLTREHYLRYGAKNAALEGIVQAMLITRRMLYVGFSLDDDNFHRIVDAVRRAIGGQDRELGTVLALTRNELVEQLWGEELTWVHLTEAAPILEASRVFEIFLDLVSAEAASTQHLLTPRFRGILTDEEQALADELQELQRLVQRGGSSPAWAVLEDALHRLGSTDE